MVFDILLLSVLVFGALLLTNFVGKCVSFLFVSSGDKYFARLFFDFLLGAVVIVLLFSTYATGLKTVNVVFIPILFLLFWINRNKKLAKPEFKVELKTIILLLVFSVVSVLISVLLGFQEKGINSDIAYYNLIAEYFLSGGSEENFFHRYNYEQPLLNGAMPYHYFEFWFAAFIQKIYSFSDFSNLMLFKYVMYNFFRVIVWIGYCMLIEVRAKAGIRWILILISLTIFTQEAFLELFLNAWPIHTNMWFRPNLIFYYLFLFPVFYYLVMKEWERLFIWLLALPIVSTVTAPAILGGLGLFVCILWFLKIIPRQQVLRLGFLFLGFAIVLFLFYKVNAQAKNVIAFENYSLAEMMNKTLLLWKAILGISSILIVKSIIILFFALVLVPGSEIKNYIIRNRLILLFSFLIAFCGIITFQLVPYIDNMYQLPYVGYVACNIGFFVVMIDSFVVYKRKRLFVSMLILFVLFNCKGLIENCKPISKSQSLAVRDATLLGYSESYINYQKGYFARNPYARGGYIISKVDAQGPHFSLRHSLTYQVGYYGALYHSNHLLYLLSNPPELYPDLDTTTKDYRKAFVFNKLAPFYFNYKKDFLYKNYLAEYINKNKLSFLYLTPGVSDTIIQYAKNKQVIVDSITSERFVILNTQ